MNNNPCKVKVDFSYLPVINFAVQQNRVNPIRQLSIKNESEGILNNVKVSLSTEPEFGASVPYAIEAIPTNGTVTAEALNINLSANYFAQITERMAGYLTLTISSDNTIIFTQAYPIDILAYDQWSGAAILPEMLSAFITPNHPNVAPIIKRAAIILEQWTGSASLDEYQSRNPDRVRKQMAAIYTAISELDIIYSTVPASFEEYGQRVRLVDTIMSQKLGTCLDMALLYASCLEAIGIHSIIVMTNGHAFSGGWLIPDTFPDSVIDDHSFITKRAADGINEITLVETTGMNMGSGMDFEQAVKIANGKINQLDFVLALDVKRTRFSGIRPLPQRILNGTEWEIKEDFKPLEPLSYTAPTSINPYDLSETNGEAAVTKQLLWERKLLDLSLRNNLLNIRITRNTLQLISADLDLLEDALAHGAEFRIMPKPTDWDNPLYDFGIYQKLSETDPVIELVKSELTQNRLRSYLPENDLAKALTHLYRSSRSALEENGANTLYIALGLLQWYETPGSERPRYAPILLLPVEIIRKSSAKGYVIRTREEDAMMNITLLEMLRQNFGITITGLDPLPTDENGVDVKLIYSIMRNGIKNQRKWDVKEQAMLGIFSFNKFIMWNDIHNNADKLKENKLVSSLMSGKIEWEIMDNLADAVSLDKQLSPADLALPINADSSQLEAIYEAMNNKSFILHGPPGTGKSQTITNIIANALYSGKRVLFVSEKMAALSVVQNRLAAIGLDPFCLELHSNKTKKTTIINQLKETTEITRTQLPDNFRLEADRLAALKKEINTYIERLHKKYSFETSLYDAITQYLSIDSEIAIPFQHSLIAATNKELTSKWCDALDILKSTSRACGHPYNHPLTGIHISAYSSSLKEEAITTIQTIIDLLAKIKNCLPIFSKITGDTASTLYNKTQTDILSNITDKLLNIPELTPELITYPRLNEILDECNEALPHGKLRDGLKLEIRSLCIEQVLQINASQMLNAWNIYSDKWFLPKYFGKKKIKKQLRQYTINAKINDEEVKPLLHKIINYQEEINYLSQHIGEFPLLFGKYGKKGFEDWDTIAKIIEDTKELNGFILNFVEEITKTAQIKRHIAQQLSEGIDSFRSIHHNPLTEINQLLNCLDDSNKKLEAQLGVDTKSLYGESEEWLDTSTQKLNYWLSNMHKLKDWYQWLLVCEQFKKLDIEFVTTAYKDKNIDVEKISDIFTKNLNKAYIDYIIASEPELELFKGNLFNDIIRRYKEQTAQFRELAKKEFFARLASNLPSFTREAAQNSEVGILQRNIRNNARGISIRRLFDQIPTLLTRMCPCMLMSPISVAQYIAPDADKFDLIVFDEASQMPTYEAIGAIARGNNVVVVGDPKQLPPTNFFSVNHIDDDNIEMEDLESILDDCLALSMPSKHLLWHYRSKHESLIAFSNSEYYDNKLLTFPSPDNIESKVKLVSVQGYYDKGKTRCNRAEAQAVIDEIQRRLCDPELRKKSIGVVTFSSVQQTLIEDMLSDLLLFNTHLEAFALECEEPIFVKNLENVQGDERDVILFSVGYGPDKEGRVSMNFGPLNRQGGERRLNVAVSRARYEMIIYSTLRSDQIDLNRTGSVGARGLKRFLAYAEKGEQIVSDKKLLTSIPVLGIENIVAQRIREHGYTVHTHIGHSGYKVDIGIVDKKNPTNYLLAILCDGENYKNTKTTQDREIVQNGVLQLLGWKVCHIWTMDWWENSDEVIEYILDAIKDAELDKPKSTTKMVEDIANIENTDIPKLLVEDDKSTNINITQNYSPTILRPVIFSSDTFFSPEHNNLIKKQLEKVILHEAPISKSLLCKRILSAWGISRLGQRCDSRIETLLNDNNYYRTEYDGLIFIWFSKEQCCEYKTYRLSSTSERDAVDLPPNEVANAMKKILTDEISLPTTDLIRLGAHTFGFARSGTNVEAAMLRGLKMAIGNGYAKAENGRTRII